MKTLYFIGGTMGVGKTSTCQILKKRLNRSVFLDGDWCWDMHPFQVTGETKRMVIANICALLNNFIACSAYDNIIFCWVMHEQGIIDDILARINTARCRVVSVSLVCTSQALCQRLSKDVERGVREAGVIERSLLRLPMYERLNTIKIDVSNIPAYQAASEILKL